MHGGLRYGIDFAGGTQVIVLFTERPDLDTLRDVLTDQGIEDPTIQEECIDVFNAANPDIEVQYRSKKMKLRARQVDDEEKARVWPTCVEHYPPFEDYQNRTDRNIPVFVCEPRA